MRGSSSLSVVLDSATSGFSRQAFEIPDAVALHDGERGRAPTDEGLRVAGIDSGDDSTGNRDPPDVLD